MDTLAKRIYQHQNFDKNQNYRRYKLFLQLIFCFQHFCSLVRPESDGDLGIRPNYGDPRYENLIRTIGEITDNPDKELMVEIPNNFNFVTWNYDVLFETTIVKDKKQGGIDNYRIVDCFQGKEKNNDVYGGAKILKLNGTAFDNSTNEDIFLKDNNGNNHDDYFFGTLDKLFKSHTKSNPINFAWENQNDAKLKEKLKELAEKTDIVVIIGYSFPTVNRLIDQAFFSNLRDKKDFKTTLKVYIQGRDYSDSVRIERLLKQCYKSNKPHFETVPVESGDFFFVPSEYFEEKEIRKKVDPSLFF
jgi:predicted GIY-YIG superfamily endonuclease